MRGNRTDPSATTASPSEALLPPEEEAYYADLERKHFSAEATGSRFAPGTTLRGLLDGNPQLLRQGDDREALLALGVEPEALLPDRSYFLLRARGEEGMIAADKLHEQESVEIRQAKGDMLSFVVRGRRQAVSLATAIVGRYPRDPSRLALITIFPGLPSDPARSSISEENEVELRDGDVVTLRELQERLGRHDLLLQVA